MNPPTADPRFDHLLAELTAEFRTFRLVEKERSRLMRLIYRGLLMRCWCPDFISGYTTVLGSVVFLPRELYGTAAGYRTLRHERVHMRDFWRWGGLPFALSYLFLLPVGLTLRSVWEMRGYAETLRAELEDCGAISQALLAHIERQFTGSAYLWMCPFPWLVRWWLARVCARLVRERAGH